MKLLQIGKTYYNINYIVKIDDYNRTYPNTSTIIYFDYQPYKKNYIVIPLPILEVIE